MTNPPFPTTRRGVARTLCMERTTFYRHCKRLNITLSPGKLTPQEVLLIYQAFGEYELAQQVQQWLQQKTMDRDPPDRDGSYGVLPGIFRPCLETSDG